MGLDAFRTAVVRITNYSTPFDWEQPYNKNLTAPPGTGTGFVVEGIRAPNPDETYVVTAYHVVSFGTTLWVEFSDAHYKGKPVEARLVAYSVALDAAVIAAALAPPEWLVPLTIGASDDHWELSDPSMALSAP